MKHCIFLLLFPCLLISQDYNNPSSFKFHYIGTTLGSSIPVEGDNLLTGGLELATSFGSHILKVAYLGGAEVDFPSGNSVGDFREWSLLYGREFRLNEWLSFDPYAGAGIFGVRVPNESDPDKTKMNNHLGIPVEGNLRLNFLKKVAFGIRGRHTFNSENGITYLGGFLQYRF